MPSLQEIEQALRRADAAGDTQAAAMLAAEYRRMQAQGPAQQAPAPVAAPAPQPAPQPAPAAPPPGPPAAPAPMVAATPPPAPVPSAPEGRPSLDLMAPTDANTIAQWKAMSPEEQEQWKKDAARAMMEGEVAKMGGLNKFFSGMGQSFDSTGRGIQQIWNYLSGDKEELAKLQKDEAQNRQQAEALLASGLGRTGQISGHIAQAFAPGGLAGKGATALGGGLVRTAATEGLAGAAMGAAAPTVEGESRTANAAIGGVTGALLPAGQKIMELPATGKAAILRMLSPRGTGGFAELAARLGGRAEGLRREAGKKMGQIAEQIEVPMNKQLASRLRSWQNEYGQALPPIVRQKTAEWIRNAERGNIRMKGPTAQEIRSNLGAEAAEAAGIARAALLKGRRIWDDAMKGQMSPAQLRKFNRANEQYRTGIKPTSEVAPGRTFLRGLVEALRAPTSAPNETE